MRKTKHRYSFHHMIDPPAMNQAVPKKLANIRRDTMQMTGRIVNNLTFSLSIANLENKIYKSLRTLNSVHLMLSKREDNQGWKVLNAAMPMARSR